MYKYAIALLLAFMLVGCAQLQVNPQNAEQTVFATKALHGTVAATTSDLLKSDIIDWKNAADIYADLDRTQEPIDEAVAIVRSGKVLPDTRLERIKLIQNLLQRWQDYLQAKGAPND